MLPGHLPIIGNSRPKGKSKGFFTTAAAYNEEMTDPRKTNRRQFLQGRSAAEALVDAVDAGIDATDEGMPAKYLQPSSYLMQIERRAMACQFAVYLNAGQYQGASEAAVEALDLVEQLEDQLTVYRDHSEISRLNLCAYQEATVVEPRLFDLLEEAVELYRATEGAFDITSATLSKVWGFYRREGQIPSEEDLRVARESVGSDLLELCRDERTVRYTHDRVEINLGGIGKGYALDRCVELMRQRDINDFLIHGGQSSVVARGNRLEGEQSQRGWTVGLRNPLRPEQRIAEIQLQDQALGTSGTATQSFYHQGRRYGHILDPRSGRPAEGVLSATVLAPTAAMADALATAFYVMGVEAALEFCRHRNDLAVVLMTSGKRRGTLQIDSIGLEENQWQCAGGDEIIAHD